LSPRQLPNLLCILRMLLVLPVAVLLARDAYVETLFVFAIAAVTDGLDGWLAKRYDWSSETGKVLDPLADKLLLVTAFVTLAAIGLTPVWLAVVVVARDVVIGAGALTYRALFGPLHGRPSAASKLNTVCQILYVLAVIAAAAVARLPGWLVTMLGSLTFVTTAVSGIDYVLTYTRRAAQVSRARRV
jgi:cardiolipin synthase (CMP-forming)